MTETPRPRILVATHNKGKRAEFEEFLAPLGIDVVSLADLGLPEPEETGTTFEENADIKSAAALAATGIPALADDSGICVDALDGRPGVYTADWAGEPRDYMAAMSRVERELGESGSSDRGARFVSVLSLALPDGSTHRFRGEVLGSLVWPPRGGMGFGFDPVFVPEGEDRTFAEMRSAEKAGLGGEAGSGTGGLSHRARSFARFAAEFLDRPEGRRVLGLS